jgi:hypothetical protein
MSSTTCTETDRLQALPTELRYACTSSAAFLWQASGIMHATILSYASRHLNFSLILNPNILTD